MSPKFTEHKFPVHGWVGILLVGIFWTLNWTLEGPRTHWGFFPLWLGYCLTVDALTFLRKGDSLLVRNGWAYLGLFAVSAPSWWIFEFINERTRNWAYLGMDDVNPWLGELLATLSFSTVIPAVFGTAELVGTFGWVRRIPRCLAVRPGPALTIPMLFFGLAALGLLFAWPRIFYPLVWVSLICILEPLNVWLGNRSILDFVGRGDWRPLFSLALGCLICGFFWEMWNYFSLPKWVYAIPFFDFARVFEMPLPGYGGYIPFSLELYAMYHFVTGAFGGRSRKAYVRLLP